jgi:hypothetical protein
MPVAEEADGQSFHHAFLPDNLLPYLTEHQVNEGAFLFDFFV